MKARPILMSAPMVRAILAGRKSQTRRLAWNERRYERKRRENPKRMAFTLQPTVWQKVLAGDVLWVRERFLHLCAEGERHHNDASGRSCTTSYWIERPVSADHIYYAADEPCIDHGEHPFDDRPSIHMPRWASRITLEVTATKVEPLQDISVDDVVAEGIDLDGEHSELFARAEETHSLGGSCGCRYPEIYPFAHIWDRLHGEGAWASNPDVVAIHFRPHLQNVDAFLERSAA